MELMICHGIAKVLLLERRAGAIKLTALFQATDASAEPVWLKENPDAKLDIPRIINSEERPKVGIVSLPQAVMLQAF